MSDKLNVLVVEDDADISSIIEISLRLNPAIFTTFASTGRAALDLLRDGRDFDLILLDAHLPDTTGLDLIAAITQMPIPPPDIIFLTADVRPRSIQAFIAAGALDVISKPFNPLTLAQQVAELVPKD